jgi:acyl-homoserine-lactone acylase
MKRDRSAAVRRMLPLFLLLLLPSCAQLNLPWPLGTPRPEPVQAEPPQQQPIEPDVADARAELLWDSYGVPHVFAQDAAALFYAFGWAQMRSHGDMILRLYGQARGRAAEYWGERFIESDEWVLTNDVPARAELWLRAQSPHMQAYLEAFVAGINAFAERNPGAIGEAWKAVLPVHPADVLAHQQRVLHFTFMASPLMVAGIGRQWLAAGAANGEAGGAANGGHLEAASAGWNGGRLGAAHPGSIDGNGGAGAGWNGGRLGAAHPGSNDGNGGPVGAVSAGSNAWAIAPARAAGGRAMLLMNPHLPWGDLFTWYEAHLVGPGIDAYGTTLVGFPILAMAFNEHLGWTHTVNTIDSADLYELTLSGDGYLFDGAPRAFETRQHTLRVRQADGSIAERPFTVRSSVHGPVVAQRDGRALALRVAGLGASNLPDQYWDMARSQNLAQFEAALSRLQLPMFTVMYADRAGNILHSFNGLVPVRPRGDWAYWQGIVPGDSSATLWTQHHQYFSLPRVLNPPSGWLQNANDPPWTTTIPFALEPAFFPAYMAPQRPLAFRPQRSIRMLMEDPRITFDEMVAYKHSTRMEAADHLVQDVVAAARRIGDVHARDAAAVLERWDRTADADSRGGVLFQAFYRAMARHQWPTGSMFEVPWTPRAPLTTPDGLSDPATAVAILSRTAQAIHGTYGALDVPWGAVHRLRRDTLDLPASGGGGDLGIFRVLDLEPLPQDTTRFHATGGDSFILALEFSEPIRAQALLTYGNATQPGSPHRADQLGLYARKEMRPVFLTREQVLNNLLRREAF